MSRRLSDAEALATIEELVRSGVARTTRVDAGLSIRQMARLIACSSSELFRIENGQSRVCSPRVARRFVYVLLGLESLRPSGVAPCGETAQGAPEGGDT
jgi:Helix-turn-helix domain